MEKKLTKEQIEKIKSEQVQKYDSEFISYINSYESAAIFIVRDVVKSIYTGGKWISVLDGTDAEKIKRGVGISKKFKSKFSRVKFSPIIKFIPKTLPKK